MKKAVILTLGVFAMSIGMVNAQDTNVTGSMNTTTVQTMNYEKNGSKIPYKVTIQEQRYYRSSFEQNQKNMENWERKNEPAEVAKLITVTSDVDKTLNRTLVVRYEKQLADTFELTATNDGFQINVEDHTVHYKIGKGIAFEKMEDSNFFFVNEFVTDSK
ncbi:hypothetical protein [Maribacter sp. 2-571]|uniref:hypothetical protein n=1 Tax=Maribacter sp. 2-571 TaxID=3417569 RepID=UPI003D34C2B9